MPVPTRAATLLALTGCASTATVKATTTAPSTEGAPTTSAPMAHWGSVVLFICGIAAVLTHITSRARPGGRCDRHSN